MMGGGGMFGFGMIIWVAILVVIVWAVVRAIGQGQSAPSLRSSTSSGSARAILDERLAKGELSVEEYKKLRDALGESRGS